MSDPVEHFVKVVREYCEYKHWRDGVFYSPRLPPRRWFEYYARHFDTVEVNSTFYRLPREAAVADVHAYFNSDWNGYAVRNGLWLRRRLGV